MRLGLLLFPLLLLPVALPAQPLLADSLQARYHRTETLFFRELCYLHLERTLFLSGEKGWFGVLVTDGLLHQPSSLSRVAYVELSDAAGQAVWQGKIALQDGLGAGEFSLPAGLASGYYRLRAYTRWMRNAHPGFFFQTLLKVVNPAAPPRRRLGSAPLAPLRASWAVEGGPWASGLPQRLVVRLQDAGGRAVPAQVRLVQGQLQDSTRLGADGLGQLICHPQAGLGARLEFRQGDSLLHQVALPIPEQGEVSLHLAQPQVGADLGLEVSRPEGAAAAAHWLVLEQRGRIHHLRSQLLAAGATTLALPAKGLVPGIFRLSLLRADGTLVASRLAAWPGDSARLVPWLAAPEAPSRLQAGETSMHYLISCSPDSLGGPSLPAYLARYSELPRPLVLPAGLAPEREHLVLAFQQGRRQPWARILSAHAPPPPFAPETEGLLLTGRLTGAKGQALPARSLFLAVPGPVARPMHGITGPEGDFSFVLPPALGQDITLVLRHPHLTDEKWQIDLDPGFAPPAPDDTWPELILAPAEWETLEAYLPYLQLQATYAAYQPPALPGPAFYPIYGRPRARYQLDDYVAMPTEEVLREIVVETIVRKNKRRTEIRLIDAERLGLMTQGPLLLVDGVPVFEAEELLRIPQQIVDRFELVDVPWYLQGNLYGGILHLITRAANFEAVPLQEGELRLTYQLCEAAPQPVSPLAPLPDLRRLPLATVGHATGQPTFAVRPGLGHWPYYLRVQILDAEGRAGSLALPAD